MAGKPSGAVCCFLSCKRVHEPTGLRIAIWVPSDLPALHVVAHAECFRESRDPSVMPDPPDEHGRVPAKARCLFCGEKLPILGRHPFAMEVRESDSTGRYWVHADCMQENVDLPQE